MNILNQKILFIDSETSVLTLLKQLLQDEEWGCYFVTSTREALDFLQQNQIDMVVSAAMGGNENDSLILAEIRRLYPDIVRILLADTTERSATVKSIVTGDASQIIPRPWVNQELKEIIRSALRQSAMQKNHSREFQILINSIPLLPTLPESYTNVRSCIVGDEVDIEKMAMYINQDVAITSSLLHWANSAMFGQRYQVDTVKKAIIVIGTDIVESIVLSESVNRTIAGKIQEINGFEFSEFKKHSMATAVLSRLLLKSVLPTDIVQQDRAFIAGLLHDIGKLAAASFFPVKFERALELARDKKCQLTEAESICYGTDHAELGGFLAEWWNLPPFIVNAIYGHHHPLLSPADHDVIIAVHVANLLSHQFCFGLDDSACQHEIAAEYQQKFHLTEEAIEILRAQTEKTIAAPTS